MPDSIDNADAPNHESTQPPASRAVDGRIVDVRRYLDALTATPHAHAPLDRSAFYRYRKDIPALQELVRRTPDGARLRLHFIGIAHGEEVLSYLSAMAAALPADRLITDRVDCTAVNVRQREDVHLRTHWGKVTKVGGLTALFAPGSTADDMTARLPPKELTVSFVYDPAAGEYAFRQDIVTCATQLVTTGRFSTPIENDLLDSPGEQHDVVACNNVLQHLGAHGAYATPYRTPRASLDEYATFLRVVDGVLSRVAPGGLLFLHTDGSITDTKGHGCTKTLSLVPAFSTDFEQVASGIYRRRSTPA